jgi:hypothetical protein
VGDVSRMRDELPDADDDDDDDDDELSSHAFAT